MQKKKITKQSVLWRLWREYFRFEIAAGSLTIIAMLIANLSTVLQLQLLQPTLDLALIKKQENLFLLFGLGFLGLSSMRGICSYVQETSSAKVGNRVVERLQNRLFKRMLKLDVGRFIKTLPGEYAARFTFDVQLLRETFSRAMIGVIRDAFLLIAYCGILFYNNWSLALIVVGLYPLMFWPIIKVGKKIKAISTRMQEAVGDLNGFLSEQLNAIRVILANDSYTASRKRAASRFNKVRKTNIRTIFWRSLQAPINETMIGCAVAILIIFGGMDVAQGKMTTGEFTVFFAAIILTYQPLRSLGNFNANLQEGIAAAKRIFDIIDSKELTADKIRAKTYLYKKGVIEFKNVSVNLEENQVLQNINLKIKPGEKLALFGKSGSGKSSFINALMRFLPLADGNILLDDQDISELNAKSFRSYFALVPQELGLISDSIAHNIALSDYPNKPDKRLLEISSKKAGAFDFIQQLPNKFNTLVGSSGTRMSGGERQRLALARAFYRDFSILLLDEASSALDNEVEKQILDKVFYENKENNNTIIFITHKIDNLDYADQVAYFSKGKLIEYLPRDEFLKKWNKLKSK